MEKLVIGMVIGALGGALLTANNYKMRTLVRKSQEEVQAKLDKLMDDKIRKLEEGTEKIVEEAENVAESVKKSVKKAVKS
jgi:uncharacterized membrane-anchored protein YhcB (DUF1043 family)